MARPRCPKCNGLLVHEPAVADLPDRILCRACGWQMYRKVEPVIPEIPSETTGKDRPIRTAYGPAGPVTSDGKHWRGICPICKRPDVLLASRVGECCRCYTRINKGQDPLATTRPMPATPAKQVAKPEVPSVPPVPSVTSTDKGVIDMPETAPETGRTKAHKKSYSYRGTCNTCLRPDLKLSGKGGICSRCYHRKRTGRDPLADLPNQGIAKPAAPSPQAPLPPPIPEQKTARAACCLDPVQCMDEIWAATRARWIRELTEAPDNITRLRLAANQLEIMNRLEV